VTYLTNQCLIFAAFSLTFCFKDKSGVLDWQIDVFEECFYFSNIWNVIHHPNFETNIYWLWVKLIWCLHQTTFMTIDTVMHWWILFDLWSYVYLYKKGFKQQLYVYDKHNTNIKIGTVIWNVYYFKQHLCKNAINVFLL